MADRITASSLRGAAGPQEIYLMPASSWKSIVVGSFQITTKIWTNKHFTRWRRRCWQFWATGRRRSDYNKNMDKQTFHAMEEALLAILGHRSAHSLATGPVMADPFISPLLFTMTPALSSK